jgi:hypothetical protein
VHLSVNLQTLDAVTGAAWLKAQLPNFARALQAHMRDNPGLRRA